MAEKITRLKSRNLHIDLIRIVAMFMILTAHMTALIYARPDFFGKSFWWLNNIVLSFCRMGTPLFFMVSGYLIGDKKRNWKINLRHAFLRLGIPFIVFYILSNEVVANIHSTPAFPDFFKNLFLGGGNYLYFLVGLAILYLINPYLQKLTQHLSQKEYRNLVIFLLVNTGLYTFGAYVLSNELEIPNPTFLYWFMTLGFFLYGAYLKKFPAKLDYKKDLKYIFLPLTVNIFLAFTLQKIALETSNSFFTKMANYSQSYLGFTVILASLYSFKVLILTQIWQPLLVKYQKILINLAQNAFGIYLVHMIILEYFLFRTPLTIDNGPFNPAIMIVLIWGALLLCSYLFTFIISQIPILRMIIGEPA